MAVNSPDMIQWISQNWNNTLTILTFIFTGVLTFYKIRDYKREIASVVIEGVSDTTFLIRDNNYGAHYTKFSYNLDIANRGREPAYVMNISLYIDEIDKSLQCTNHQRTGGRTFQRIGLGETERNEVYLVATDSELHQDIEEFHGELRLDTSTGEITKDITFSQG